MAKKVTSAKAPAKPVKKSTPTKSVKKVTPTKSVKKAAAKKKATRRSSAAAATLDAAAEIAWQDGHFIGWENDSVADSQFGSIDPVAATRPLAFDKTVVTPQSSLRRFHPDDPVQYQMATNSLLPTAVRLIE